MTVVQWDIREIAARIDWLLALPKTALEKYEHKLNVINKESMKAPLCKDFLNFSRIFFTRSLVRKASLMFYGVVFFASCNDEVSNPLAGTWIMKATTTQNCKDKSQNIAITYSCDDSSCCKYIFSEDGSLQVEHFLNGTTTVTKGSYTISNSTVSIDIEELPNDSPVRMFTSTLSGSTLYLKEIITDLSGRCSDTMVLMK